jgi:hypothetical protein
MKCKNIECENETKNNNVYCSTSCRSVYVNKYLRDYKKVSETFKNKRIDKEKEYYTNPKKCKECNLVIDYDKKLNTFCSNSCSTTYTNKRREHTWGDNIRKGISEYLVREGIVENLESVGKYKKICKGCGKNFITSSYNLKYCEQECKKEYRRKNMSEYQKYKLDTHFKFSLNEYPKEFDFELVKEHGWYSPSNKNNNLYGVSRDHMLSVMEGFESDINPFLLAHPANCKLITQRKNSTKHKKSSLTIKELKEKIKKFDKKYGKYYEKE